MKNHPLQALNMKKKLFADRCRITAVKSISEIEGKKIPLTPRSGIKHSSRRIPKKLTEITQTDDSPAKHSKSFTHKLANQGETDRKYVHVIKLGEAPMLDLSKVTADNRKKSHRIFRSQNSVSRRSSKYYNFQANSNPRILASFLASRTERFNIYERISLLQNKLELKMLNQTNKDMKLNDESLEHLFN